MKLRQEGVSDPFLNERRILDEKVQQKHMKSAGTIIRMDFYTLHFDPNELNACLKHKIKCKMHERNYKK